MLMYTIKSDEGYLKVASDNTFILCTLHKASVYKDIDTVLLLIDSLNANEKGKPTNLRIAQLTITENDYYHS